MKKLSIVMLLALLFSAIGVSSAAAQSMTGMMGMVTMMEQNGSGQNGEVTLMDAGNGQTTVTVNIKSGATGVAQPAHIHEGTCATLNPKPLYPLNNVVNGMSVTTVNVSLDTLKSGTYAVNVHKSGPEAAVYVSCGDLTMMHMAAAGGTAPASGATTMVTMNAQNGSGQSGMAHLTANADGTTTVVLDIAPGAAGVAQPAHIHEGTCATLNPKPLYPLNNVVDGKSTTTVNVSLAALMAGQSYAINVHKSGPEASVYVSCGDILETVPAGPVAVPSTGSTGAMSMVTLSAQNGSGQNGMAHLTANTDGTTTVVVDVTPGAAGVAQPIHIHKGTCATLDPKPLYPLTSVMDGKSTTTVNVSLADLTSGAQAYAINIHKSGPEASVYVSCGDIVAMAVSGPSTQPAPGMPTTGNGGESIVLFGLVALILTMISAGVMLRRRA